MRSPPFSYTIAEIKTQRKADANNMRVPLLLNRKKQPDDTWKGTDPNMDRRRDTRDVRYRKLKNTDGEILLQT